ncbi:hypothetical protein B0T19DRAFT_465441 [Cercophora scortea]|uniref:Uncharacterized protein n=1 Tax=Cercophora scortea TaxID=314031 RepID=A0AAE0M699_9PEZI|nr:hypothetical protein B0T19DRAFT_465441 [Cercophora scortea]
MPSGNEIDEMGKANYCGASSKSETHEEGTSLNAPNPVPDGKGESSTPQREPHTQKLQTAPRMTAENQPLDPDKPYDEVDKSLNFIQCLAEQAAFQALRNCRECMNIAEIRLELAKLKVLAEDRIRRKQEEALRESSTDP